MARGERECFGWTGVQADVDMGHFESFYDDAGADGVKGSVESTCNFFGDVHECVVLDFVEVEDVGHLSFGNDEHLSFHGRKLIGKNDGMFILINNFLRNFSFNDFGKYTVGHWESVA